MISTPIDVREIANADVEAIVDYYAAEAGGAVVMRFIDELSAAYGRLSATPAAGSARLDEALNLGGARTWSLRTYPYLIVYFDRADRVEIWRVLHGQRDLEALLS